MPIPGGLALALLFLWFGHSNLLHFFIEERRGELIAPWRVLWPWPRRQWFAPMLSIVVGLGFLTGSIVTTLQGVVYHYRMPFIVLFITVYAPLGSYAWYLARRLERTAEGVRFRCAPPEAVEYAVSLGGIAVVGLLARLFS